MMGGGIPCARHPNPKGHLPDESQAARVLAEILREVIGDNDSIGCYL